jgi:histidyl-tRNA synthetase
VFQKPRGTRDFTSEEMQKRRHVEKRIRSTFISYAYTEIQTPTFETLELFTAKSGEEIIEELYSFKDKGSRNLALRPELTAPVIRFYVEKLQMEPKPIKLFYFGNCYRYDRPQKGRYREFTQAGCELIGTDTIEAVSELIALAYNIIKNVGVKDFKLNVGNLNILNLIFKRLNLKSEQQKYLIPLIDKSKYEDVLEVLGEYGIDSNIASTFIDLLETNDFTKIRDFLKNDIESKDEIDRFQNILDYLKGPFKIDNINVKLGIVRGLDYYRSVVFEIEAPALGAEKQLCGGGVYDLVSLFGGKDTPTSGFAIGFDRTIVALESENYSFPRNNIDVFVVPLEEELYPKALEILHLLRENKISADWDLLKRGISKSLKYASSINSKYAIFLGQDEINQDSVKIKDLESGKQELVKFDRIIDFFKV